MRLGSRSGWLTDLDFDCREACELADLYLPASGAVFGRKSKPRSHWLYVAPGAVFETFSDPISGEMLLELRADGRTAVRTCPCSRRPLQTVSGENGTAMSLPRERSTHARCGLLRPGLRLVASQCATSARMPPGIRARICRSCSGSSTTSSGAPQTDGLGNPIPMHLSGIRDDERS